MLLADTGFFVLRRFGADAATGGEHLAVLGDLGQRHTAAEAGNALTGESPHAIDRLNTSGDGLRSSGRCITAPDGDGVGNLSNRGIDQLSLHAADQLDQLALAEEQYLPMTLFLRLHQKPQTGWNLGDEKRWPG